MIEREPMTDPRGEAFPDDELVPADDVIIGRAFRWSLVVIAAAAGVVGLGFWLAREKPTPEAVIVKHVDPPAPLVQDAPEMPAVRFTDITTAAGITFVHNDGAEGEKLLPETMGGGCAFFDHDGDGDQDLLLVNSAFWPHSARAGEASPPALYRNDGAGRFSDVTREAGLDTTFYGMGVAVGDYDNDGDRDLFLTAVGPNHLFRNEDGAFREVTGEAGVAGAPDQWSSSAGFFDYDNDGDLDLFVCNYVHWSREIDHQLAFQIAGLGRAYGPPTNFEGAHPALYRNDGDGTFTDVSEAAGIRITTPLGTPMAKALAQVFVDVNRDGFLDVMVANDTVRNFLFLNNGDPDDPAFTEIGVEAGVAFDAMGNSTGAMGIDAADVRNEDRLAIGIGNFANEPSSLYAQQDGRLSFADMSSAEGIATPSRMKLSFGLFFFDYDLDGRLDLLQANGHLEHEINVVQASQHYRQAAQLFWNCGPGATACFAAVPEADVGDLAARIVGRGAAYADIDDDGDLDVLITQTGDRPLLLRNDQDLGHHWLRVKLAGTTANRDAIGARVELRVGGLVQRRAVMPTRSYLSQVELPVTFGLGPLDAVESLRVVWPDGSEQLVRPDAVDTTLVIRQGG